MTHNETLALPGEATAQSPRRSGEYIGARFRANPETSWWIRTVRTLLPVWLRRRIAHRLSPHYRQRLKRLLAVCPSPEKVRNRARSRLAVYRYPQAFADGRRLRLERGVPKAVLTRPDITPLAARRHNLSLVCSTLQQAGIDYFCVRGKHDGSTVVAVSETDRHTVLRELALLCERTAGYVSPLGNTAITPRSSKPGYARATWRALSRTAVIRMTWYQADPTLRLVLGTAYGCDLEFWTADGDFLLAPRPNRITDRIPRHDTAVQAPDALFSQLYAAHHRQTSLRVRTRQQFQPTLPDDITFPIDAVYTWVDGQDPAWLQRRAAAGGQPYHAEAANSARYVSHDELRYSLRSLHQYAPWVRTVYLVTDQQVPHWLDTSAPGVQVVSHHDIFRDPSILPTFNSHAIESQLHHIDGLSEHFLYFNDDVFLGRPVLPQHFFRANGITKFFPSPAHIPLGPPSCDDPPVCVAGKNNRTLLQSRFNVFITQKMKHTPHALRRSVLQEIEDTFSDQHRTTAGNRFRSLNDLSIASNLHHYYAHQTGRATPAELRYTYLDLSHPHTAARLDRLLASRDRHSFCLNDTVSGEQDIADQQALLSPFLDSYFPVPSPLEQRAGSC
ncbi:stealth family protein [Streptomyces sp. NBC_01614]|uniref:Stealth family protein n=1 Tax=Streptomyces sp. NBC_00180 TaxID=2903632 RepID=A0AAU1I911_9ACTN